MQHYMLQITFHTQNKRSAYLYYYNVSFVLPVKLNETQEIFTYQYQHRSLSLS